MYPKKRPKTDLEKFYEAFGKKVGCKPEQYLRRTAIFKAVSEGEREFAAIAVVGGKNGDAADIFPPCGVCRQVMQEFCAPDFMIYMGRSDGSYVAESLGAMLPYGFTAEKYMK